MTVPNKGISFDNKEMCHILENIRDADSLSDPNINPKEKNVSGLYSLLVFRYKEEQIQV